MSREIDERVAREVMNWTKYRAGCIHAAEGRTFYETALGGVWRHKWEDDFGPSRTLFCPSADIGAAWEVWANPHVCRHVECLYPSIDEDTGKLMHWVAVTRINKDRRGHVADTAAKALCEAALAAVARPPGLATRGGKGVESGQ